MAFARARGAVRIGAVAAAVLISGLTGGLTALPAQAAGSTFDALVSPAEVTLLPQSSGAPAQQFHQIGLLLLPIDGSLSGVTVTVDASKAAGVAELSLPKGCAYTDAAKLHERCSVGAVGTMDQFKVGLRSAAGAALGAKGTVSFAVTAANATLDRESGPLTSTVTIGSGPDLAVGELPTKLDVRTGQATPVNPTVQNLGDRPVSGVTLVLDTSDPANFPLSGDWSNCLYGGQAAVVCHFDTVVQPGQAYQLAAPVTLTPGAHAMDGAGLVYGWDVKGGVLDQQLGTGGKPGKGAPLTLVPAQRPALARTQVDINYDNNIGISLLHLVAEDDVAVVAPRTITGTVGHTVAATFGVRNAGSVPTRTIDGSPGATAAVLVVLPKGVSVATLPKGCELIDGPGPAGGAQGDLRGLAARGFAPHLGAGDPPPAVDGTPYGCLVRTVLQPGQRADFTFSLKPTEVLKQAEGLAVAIGQQNDNTPDNNMAMFAVTATSAAVAPKPTPKPTHTPAPAASASNPSGGLAHTGVGSSALPLTVAGASAIALGTGAVLLTRRRRRDAGHA